MSRNHMKGKRRERRARLLESLTVEQKNCSKNIELITMLFQASRMDSSSMMRSIWKASACYWASAIVAEDARLNFLQQGLRLNQKKMLSGGWMMMA